MIIRPRVTGREAWWVKYPLQDLRGTVKWLIYIVKPRRELLDSGVGSQLYTGANGHQNKPSGQPANFHAEFSLCMVQIATNLMYRVSRGPCKKVN